MDFTLSAQQLELQERAKAAGAALRGRSAEWDRSNKVPYSEVVEHVRAHGLLGLTMPTEYGGQGLTAMDYLITVEAMFRNSQFWAIGEPLFATAGPGPCMVMMAESQTTRDKFLPDLVTGARQCAIALTEPDFGSDLTSLVTTAERRGDDWVLNGKKNFVTGATVNQLYAVFVRFDDIAGHRGIGAVIVEEGMPGVTIEAGPEFLGCRGIPHGDLTLENVVIPVENIIRGPGSFGDLMTAFNMERLHNCAFNLGMAGAAYDEAERFVRERVAFGRPLAEFQAVYHALVDMWTDLEALRLMARNAAASAIDGNYPRALETTAAKLYGARVASQITLKALELHGGYGATTNYAIERIHRDVVATIVAGGSPPVLRNAIAALILPGVSVSQRSAGAPQMAPVS
ncbi:MULTISPECIES: acyl-CoA dehydrogenase family protein [unclassified Rhodococcus (in: high G+C Gram-positive bacteria)]|uniref:acyl-CoA dehydrogenase family protein n=1 Tax=Rhodococcus sp. A14 TaxID=1194106 RepID=UPI001215AEEE|nr:acyl-CoA/acyl-ACP dehydrogenase [Rhodococcus sp. IEGM 248]NHU44259.1 acyl-CoA/acyl-ACP dehydrogenase [Rhodococcus sp. A14]RZK59370.1 MAG: acyl-CoA dehydrogenase [Rhodococcus sp. (in: high G+C Gram-positive bacteria)]